MPHGTRRPTRRAWLTGVAAGGAALALPRRRARAFGLPGPPAAAPSAPGRRIGFALVGIGKLTQTQLIPALATTKVARLTALVIGPPDKAKQRRRRRGRPRGNIYSYEKFDRIADNPDVDVVYVVLPNSMHAEYTIRALRAGKHVYCEKPMAVSRRRVRADDRRREEGGPQARHRLPPALRAVQPGADPHRPRRASWAR